MENTRLTIINKVNVMPLHLQRPETFDGLFGNEVLVDSLEMYFEKSDPNRSILITGPSGCGKTTIAYIIARKLEVFGTRGFIELNSSDFRGIDTIREIRESVRYKPIDETPCRIWMMDECHKLTPDAQESFLKLLESPPKDVWFILCTTEPEKLKVTLKRRCTSFEVETLKTKEMENMLRLVGRRNRKRIPSNIVEHITDISYGSPGIALSILEKVIDLDPKDMENAATRFVEQQDTVISLCQALLKNKSWAEVIEILKSLENEDPETLRRKILEYFRKVLIGGDDYAFVIMDAFREPFYNTGKAGLVMACYETLNMEE